MISQEHFFEAYWNLRYRPALVNSAHLERFRRLRSRYSEMCDHFVSGTGMFLQGDEGYPWREWSRQIRRSFEKGVPEGFLAHPALAKTMVFSRRGGIKTTCYLIGEIISVLGEQKARILLREDCIGNPTLQNVPYMTSANRAWHAYHLSRYAAECKKEIWDVDTLAEWGGGYGNMARIVRKMNPAVTYVIIDLPELLALQYVYLASIEGIESVHLATPQNRFQILPGKINLISSREILSEDISVDFEGFISTWAITESPREFQEYVVKKEYFGAKQVLLGFSHDAHNFIANNQAGKPFRKIQVPFSEKYGPNNQYWIL